MTTPNSMFRDFCEKYPDVIIEKSISPTWYPLLNEAFAENLEKLAELNNFLKNCRMPVNPAKEHIWAFTRFCDPNQVEVVIMGQEPYGSKYLRNAMGFSVNRPEKYIPSSLKIILEEVEEDILSLTPAPILRGYPPSHGCLEHWAEQGVVFLNSVLTVAQESAGSHLGKGWEEIVGSILRGLENLNQRRGGALVFMLWGASAWKMERFLNDSVNQLILKKPHPLPQNKFTGCRNFSEANVFLDAAGRKTIDWSLTKE